MENLNRQENKEIFADLVKIITDPGERKLLQENYKSEKRIWFVLTQSLELYLGASGHAQIYFRRGLPLYSEIDGCFINLPEHKGGNAKNFEFKLSQQRVEQFLEKHNNLFSNQENMKKILREKIVNYLEEKK